MIIVRKILLGLFFFTLAGGLLPIFAQNTQYSDYQFQQDLYRKNYATYQLFLKDYLSDSSLNNEQKAIQAAKEALKYRESTLSHFYWWQAEILNASQIDLPIVKQSISDLNTVGQYHYAQSQDTSLINTKSDLKKFTLDNRKQVDQYDIITVKSQVIIKLARLVQFQNDLKRAYDYLNDKLDAQKDILTVKNGLEQIFTNANKANELLEKLTVKINDLDLSELRQSQFFEKSVESMTIIKSLQSRSIDIIVELDTNYVAR